MAVEDEATGALATLNLAKKRGIRDSKIHKERTKPKNDEKIQIECYYCKKKSHFSRDCRKRKRDFAKDKIDKKSSENSTFIISIYTEDQQGDKQCELTGKTVRELLSKEFKDIWITDSDASRHIIFRRE